MTTLLTRSETAATALAFTLAATGTRLRSAGSHLATVATDLRGRAARSQVVAPGALAAALLLLSLHPAAADTAGGTGSLNTFLTNVMNLITGTTGQIIAVIAIALSGVGAMLGAFSIRAFGGVVLGCAIVFSAAWIVGQITGSAA